jgi:hypothetical protein
MPKKTATADAAKPNMTTARIRNAAWYDTATDMTRVKLICATNPAPATKNSAVPTPAGARSVDWVWLDGLPTIDLSGFS